MNAATDKHLASRRRDGTGTGHRDRKAQSIFDRSECHTVTMAPLTPWCRYGNLRVMGRLMGSAAKRPRISIDVAAETRRRLRLAAAKHDLTVRQYVLQAVEERLREDLGTGADGLLSLTAEADPVLARLWDNPKDAEYDRL